MHGACDTTSLKFDRIALSWQLRKERSIIIPQKTPIVYKMTPRIILKMEIVTCDSGIRDEQLHGTTDVSVSNV